MARGEAEILLAKNDSEHLELTLHAVRRNSLVDPIKVARDGEQALDLLLCRGEYANRNPDRPRRLVLLDLTLPKLNGLQVLTRLNNNPATKAVPVVILTESREEQDLISSYQQGVNSYIRNLSSLSNSFGQSNRQDCSGS